MCARAWVGVWVGADPSRSHGKHCTFSARSTISAQLREEDALPLHLVLSLVLKLAFVIIESRYL